MVTDHDLDQVILSTRGGVIEARLVFVSVSGLPVREVYPIPTLDLKEAALKLGRWLAGRHDVVSAHKARVRVETTRGLEDEKSLREILSAAFLKIRQQ